MLLLYHDFLDPKEITQLPHDWSRLGKGEALERLTLRLEREGHKLQPTALLHEAYQRLVGQNMPGVPAPVALFRSGGATDAPDSGGFPASQAAIEAWFAEAWRHQMMSGEDPARG